MVGKPGALNLALATMAVMTGAGSYAAEGAKQMHFTAETYDTLTTGPQGKHCWLVQKPGEWNWIAKQFSGPGAQLPAPQAADFKKYSYVVIDYGLATSAVHINVDQLTKSPSGLNVELALRTPAPGVSSDGKTHRLLTVLRCNKTTGPLVVQVKCQEYDNLGFIREKNCPAGSTDVLLRGTDAK